MNLFILLIFTYFVIFKHKYHTFTLPVDTNNISLMNTSTKIISNQIPYVKSFVIFGFSLFSTIILCLYAIFHKPPSISTIKQKIKANSFNIGTEQDLLTTTDSSNSSSSNDSSVIKQQTSSALSQTNNSYKS